MEIKNLAQQDIHLVSSIQPETWPDITPAISWYVQSDFCFPIQLLHRNQLLGIGTVIFHRDTVWLAHIVVHPQYRNQGLGMRITEELIRMAQKKNMQSINLIATELGEHVYNKLGFETDTEYLIYQDIETGDANNRSKYMQTAQANHIPLMAQMDKEIFGEDRIKCLEPHFPEAWVFEKNNKLEGYYLPALGEGMIAARTQEAGLALMQYRFLTKNTAAFPINNDAAKEYLQANGYAPFRKAKRMRLGKQQIWQAENHYNRIGGNLG